MTHIKQQNIFITLRAVDIITVLIISMALEMMKIFLLFMCVTLLWALHIVIKQQFFTFIFAIFLVNLACSFRQTLPAISAA